MSNDLRGMESLVKVTDMEWFKSACQLTIDGLIAQRAIDAQKFIDETLKIKNDSEKANWKPKRFFFWKSSPPKIWTKEKLLMVQGYPLIRYYQIIYDDLLYGDDSNVAMVAELKDLLSVASLNSTIYVKASIISCLNKYQEKE